MENLDNFTVEMGSNDDFTGWPANHLLSYPADLTPPSIPFPIPRKYPKACIVCRDRKVKCDRQLPCATCKRWGIEDCIYPSPIRHSPRPKRSDQAKNTNDGPDKLLLDRLKKLEAMVQRLGGSIESEPMPPRSSSGLRSPEDPTSDGTSSEKGLGRLVTKDGRTRYLSPAFWVDIDEVDDLDVIIDSKSSTTSDAAPALDEESFNGFPFIPSAVNVQYLYPPNMEKRLYWQTYCERVDPLIKILHKPTMEKVLFHEYSLSSSDKGITALTFAIYYSAAMSMTSNEVGQFFGQQRLVAIQYYRNGLEKALVDASFLETQEITTLQALILYLVCTSYCGAKAVWSLSGVAMRLAQSMGLHRDGTKLGLSALETETRRRLWWQIWYLDVRSGEDHGTESSAMSLDFDTKIPLNINDLDLHPDMTSPAADQDGLTDVTFAIIRFEMARASCRVQNGAYGNGITAKEKLLNECFQKIESRYLKFCHGRDDTLYWLVENITRMVMDKSWFMLYHSPKWLEGEASMSRALQDRLFIIAIKIIERTEEMENDPRAEKWIWLSRNYFQWLPRAFILAELCTREPSELVTRAWSTIDSTFQTWSQTTANSKNGILLKRLMAKASANRKMKEAGQVPTSSTNTISSSGTQLDSSALYPQHCFVQVDENTGDLSQSIFQPWDPEVALPQSSFPSWSSVDFPEMDIPNDPIYTGEWNHVMTDFGGIVQYDSSGSKQYPNIGPGV